MDRSRVCGDDRCWRRVRRDGRFRPEDCRVKAPSMLKPAVIVIATCLFSGSALAHAHLKVADPAGDARVAASPTALSLSFSEALEAKLSGVTLKGPDGKTIATGAPVLDAKDKRVMRVPLDGALRAGKYTVQWRALSKDGHSTHGSYDFTVAP
jgi:methionine-rich copper-binding protein CopC